MLTYFDPRDFWERSEYATETYVDDPLTPDKVSRVEQALCHTLPASDLALMQSQNGGVPKRLNHRTAERASWADDHVAITGLLSIGDAQDYSLCGSLGSQFMIDEWGSPPIGI